MSDPVYLSRRQIAQRWGCSPRTIERMKELTPVRIGKRMIRYRLEEVLAMEQKEENQPQPEQEEGWEPA